MSKDKNPKAIEWTHTIFTGDLNANVNKIIDHLSSLSRSKAKDAKIVSGEAAGDQIVTIFNRI